MPAHVNRVKQMQHARFKELERHWNADKTVREIASLMGYATIPACRTAIRRAREAGYDLKPRTQGQRAKIGNLGEAREVIREAVERVQEAGYEVWLFADAIMVGDVEHSTFVDPTDLDAKPSATQGVRRYNG